jgi:hypothetical protein
MSCMEPWRELSATHLLSFPDSINPWGQAASSYPHTRPHTCSQSYIRIPTVYEIHRFEDFLISPIHIIKPELHCKDKMPKIWNKYSQKRNIGASVPISTIMCLWANYILPRWVCLFCWRKYVDRSWEYINLSQTHECGNWGWGCAIPRKGIYKRNCRCSVYCTLRTY